MKTVIVKNLILLLVVLISHSNFGQNDNAFSLHGKTKGLPDGTVLLFQDPLKDKFIDSVKVIGNSFVLNTQVTDSPVKLILWRDSSTAKRLWVENKPMSFDSSNSNFGDAIINGSVTDSLVTSLMNSMKELPYEEMVSLEIAFIKNNPNTVLSVHNLSIMASVFGQEETKKLFEKLSIKNKQ